MEWTKSSSARFRSGVGPRSIRSSVIPWIPAITSTVIARARGAAGRRGALGSSRTSTSPPLLVDLRDRATDLRLDHRHRRQVEVEARHPFVVVEDTLRLPARRRGPRASTVVAPSIAARTSSVIISATARPAAPHQALLGAEVVRDQRLRLPGAGGDLGNGQTGVAVGLEHLDRRLQDALARAGGGAAAAGGRRAGPCGRGCCPHGYAVASIAGSSPIAASFFESDLARTRRSRSSGRRGSRSCRGPPPTVARRRAGRRQGTPSASPRRPWRWSDRP